MKTKFTISILALVALTGYGWSQPVITGCSGCIELIGAKSHGYNIPGVITHGSTGANQTWDYSLVPYDTSTFYFENIGYAALSPTYQAAYPTGNLANEYFLGGSSVTKLVFELDTNQLLFLGVGSTPFPTPVPQLFFPHNYLETHFGALTYDAYGTLITPFGTYNDVVRLEFDNGDSYSYRYCSFNPYYMIHMQYDVDSATLAISSQLFLDLELPVGAGINDEVNTNDQVNIYPNPSTGKFIIEQQKMLEGMSLEVYNAVGEKVLQQQTTNEIDLTNFPKGIYFVKIYDGEKSYTNKIVVQ